MGEVAERSEDGEGNKAPGTLSVTFGDSSPKGGAKGQKTERRRISHGSKNRSVTGGRNPSTASLKVNWPKAKRGRPEPLTREAQKAPLSKGAVSEADRGIQSGDGDARPCENHGTMHRTRPCLSLWERCPSAGRTERETRHREPSQSPSVTAPPKGEPRGSIRNVGDSSSLRSSE